MRTHSPELKTGLTIISSDKKEGWGKPKPSHSWSQCTLSLITDQARQFKYTLIVSPPVARGDQQRWFETSYAFSSHRELSPSKLRGLKHSNLSTWLKKLELRLMVRNAVTLLHATLSNTSSQCVWTRYHPYIEDPEFWVEFWCSCSKAWT